MIFGCPNHPGHKLLAYQQTAFSTTCTISIDDGEAEIEMDDRTEFVRDMETTTIICYLCSVDGCIWSATPEQVGRFARENRGGPCLTDPDERAQAAQWEQEVAAAHTSHEADEISGENEEGYDPYGEADSIEDPEFHVDQEEEPIVWQRDLEQEEGESNDDFHRRKAEATGAAVQARKAAAEAGSDVESPLTKFGRVFGGG